MKKLLLISLFFIANSLSKNSEKILSEMMEIESKTKITIDYVDRDLEFILLELAAFKGINVLIPQENQKLNAKVTYQKKEKIPVDEAWNLVLEMLTIAGYSLKEQQGIWTVIKTNSIAGEALPVFVNQNPPNNENPVRYLYFFENISISGQDSSTKANIESILSDMLTPPAQSNYMFSVASNALIITDKASIINGVMNIIKTIDMAGFREAIAVVPLRYSKASNVVKVLNQLIPTDQNQIGYSPLMKKENAKQDKYFSEDTKITSIDYSNSIVLLGNREAINQIKDFIYQYIDLPLETDRSVIHIVHLNYLDAVQFAPVLQSLLTSGGQQGGQGSQSTSTTSTIGLQNVIVVAEQQNQAQQQNNPQGPQPVASGGNNLVIAAREQDMKSIEKIIKQMDKPEPQVVLESVIVDLTQEQFRYLGFNDTRSPNNPSNPYLIKWQGNTQGAGGAAILNYVSTDGQTPQCGGQIDSSRGLAADLLAPCLNSDNQLTNFVTSGIGNGSLLVSFNDACGSVASLLQILDQYSIANIVSDPFIVTKNNQRASVTSSETRIVQGATQAESTGGPIVINQEQIEASLKVDILPRIANDNTINLEITVEISSFADPDQNSGNNSIDRRMVKTSTNLKSGEVLVIGGLAKSRLEENIQESPFGNIPLIGWLFKQQERIPSNKSLYVFISPSVVHKAADIGAKHSKLLNDMNISDKTFTDSKIDFIRDALDGANRNLYGNNFEGLRDPVTRIFFAPEKTSPSERSGDYIPLR